MELKVTGKTIDTAPIKHLLRQGEANVDIISIPLGKNYGGVDISGFEFELRAYSEKETMARRTLGKKVSADRIILTWQVSAIFTTVDGSLDLIVVGMDADGSDIIMFTGEKIIVQKTQGEIQLPIPSVVEDALRQMSVFANSAANSADRAEAAAAKSGAMLEEAKRYTNQQVDLALTERIYKVPYYDPTDGNKRNLQDVLDRMYSQRIGAYTWNELEEKNLTCAEFEALGLTCNDITKGGW